MGDEAVRDDAGMIAYSDADATDHDWQAGRAYCHAFSANAASVLQKPRCVMVARNFIV
jgi:ABC-type Fe3+ transport system substrate-binding protein